MAFFLEVALAVLGGFFLLDWIQVGCQIAGGVSSRD